MEGSYTSLLGDFEKVSCVGRVPPPNDEDEGKAKLINILDKLMDGILPFLMNHMCTTDEE